MRYKDELGKRLFSFAVIADTHLNKDEADCNSPFAVNKLANQRMRHVVRDLNQRDIAFVVHLGDLIHPVPAVSDLYRRAAERFKQQVADLRVPLYLTPGNHDIGDKPMPWAPAGSITDAYIHLWEDVFGPHYYAFDHADIRFIVINSQLMNSGLAAEAEQERQLENDIKAAAGRRIFICTHYPPFLCEADEPEHYDNIAEPARSRLLHLAAEHKVEAFFAGHVHNYWYLRKDGAKHYLLPSTAFVRQDYSEMFAAPPDAVNTEFGRNDAAKLGYFIVHIHERGHDCQMVRTYGACLAPEDPQPQATQHSAPISPRTNNYAALGFDLRRSWAESVAIPPSGALDEFDRKEVRNDYILLALLEMGVKHLRIPMQDLRNARVRARMEDLAALGCRFRLFSYGAPTLADKELLRKHAGLLSGWEVAFRQSELDPLLAALNSLPSLHNPNDPALPGHLPLYLSRLWEHDENIAPDGRYYHVMNHGFTANDHAFIEHITTKTKALRPGFVFRCMLHDNICATLNTVTSMQAKSAWPASVHLRLSGPNPAEAVYDDHLVSLRTAEALFCAAGKPVIVFADTLTDIDRGYFPHYGVLDQVCNPRPAARVIAHLHAALNEGQGPISAITEIPIIGRLLTARQGQDSIGLYLPHATDSTAALALPEGLFAAGHIRRIDLHDGHVLEPSARASTADMIFFRSPLSKSDEHTSPVHAPT